MTRTTTSMRLDEELRSRLQRQAEAEAMSLNALIERMLREGLDIEDHPGVIFVTGPSGRRASVVAAPDVWEIMATWRYLDGTEEERIAALIADYGLTKWQINAALNYAATHREEIDARIEANDRGLEEFERLAAERQRLLA